MSALFRFAKQRAVQRAHARQDVAILNSSGDRECWSPYGCDEWEVYTYGHNTFSRSGRPVAAVLAAIDGATGFIVEKEEA